MNRKYLVGILAAAVVGLVPATASASSTNLCVSSSQLVSVTTPLTLGGCLSEYTLTTFGEVGPTGPEGKEGKTGATGATGSKGAEGETGAQGPEGKEGPKGTTGATGATGSEGFEGNSVNAKSATGAECPNGGTNLLNENAKKEHLFETDVCNGEKGAKGETGATGSKGEAGKEGPKGEAGEAFAGYELTAKKESSTSATTTVGEQFGVSGECPEGKKVISIESSMPGTDKLPTLALLGTEISGTSDQRWEVDFVVTTAGTTKKAFAGRAICAA